MMRRDLEDNGRAITGAGAPRAVYSDVEAYGPGLFSYGAALGRGARILAASVAAGALLGYGVTAVQAPVYEARASLEIQGVNENFLNLAQAKPTSIESARSSRTDMRTHVRLLESRTLAQAALNKIEDPAEETRKALIAAAEDLEVSARDDSRVVDILTRSSDPDAAAEFLNRLAAEFIESAQASRGEAARSAELWLSAQLEKQQAQLEESEQRLQAYARKRGLRLGRSPASAAFESLAGLEQRLAEARAERMLRQSEAEAAAAGDPASAPEILDNQALRELKLRLAELRRSAAELGALYTPAHYRLKQTAAQVGELERAIEVETRRVLERVRTDYAAAERREALIDEDYRERRARAEREAELAIGYEIRRREVETSRDLYETLLERVKQAGLAAAMSPAYIRVLDPAVPPREPSAPNPPLGALTGAAAALLLAGLLLVAREWGDDRIRGTREAADLLGLRAAGVIPDLSAVGRDPLDAGAAITTRGAPDVARPAFELSGWRNPASAPAEAYRSLRASLLYASAGADSGRVIVVTSPGPGEGKTTTAANLAVAFAELGRRTLLIDADLRRPRLHEIFGVRNRAGLADLLRGSDGPRQAGLNLIDSLPVAEDLRLLPAGVAPHGGPGLLHGRNARRLVEALRRDYDLILIDAPPALEVSDARALAQLSDGVLLVVRAGRTERRRAWEAARVLSEDGARLLGVALNAWDPRLDLGRGDGLYADAAQRIYHPTPRKQKVKAAAA